MADPPTTPGSTYFDQRTGSWVTVQPDGSILPYKAPPSGSGHTVAEDIAIAATPRTSYGSSTSVNLTKQIEKVGSSFYVFDPANGSFTPTGITDPNGTKQIINTPRGSYIVDSATNSSQLIPGTAPLTTPSPDEVAQQTGANDRNNASLAANASEGAANRGLTASEGAANRAASADTTAADRAERVAEFAASYGQKGASDQNAYNQYVAGFQRQQTQDKLAAADQYAKEVSLVDPAALPAFYQAGGGNIMNAIHNGGTALSDNAIAPAAQTLQTLQSPWAQPAPFVQAPAFAPGFTTPTLTPQQQQANALGAQWNAAHVPADGNQTAGVHPPGFYDGIGGPGTTYFGNSGTPNASGAMTAGPPTVTPAMSPPGTNAGTQNAAMQAAGVPSWVQGFANGTQGTDARTFVAGDSHTPFQNPEMIHIINPGPDTRAQVVPMQGFSGLPHFADGTDPNNPALTGASVYGGQSPLTPDLQPYADQVRQLRQGTDVTPPISGGYMNAGWGNVAPSLQNRYYAGFQDAYGIPQSDTAAQADQYKLQGLRRQPVYGLVAQPGY